MSEHRELVSKGSLVETVVKVAATCNNLLIGNCNPCTLYCDKQVQYEEWAQDQYKMDISPLGNLFSKIDVNSLEVQMYREFLFDEENVVEQVSSREE
jgi:hypothetical protein